MTSEPPDRSAPSVRASDAEREATAQLLAAALSEGRLGLEEYDQRLTEAMGARTRGELTPVTADLPTAHAREVTTPEPHPTPSRRTSTAQWPYVLGGGLFIAGIWGVPAIVTGNLNVLWLLVPVALWGVLFLLNSGSQGETHAD